MIRLIVTVSIALASAPAVAEAPEQKSAELNSKAAERVICKRIEEIGSRLAKKRICMTAEQWEEQRRADRETVELIQQKSQQPD